MQCRVKHLGDDNETRRHLSCKVPWW